MEDEDSENLDDFKESIVFETTRLIDEATKNQCQYLDQQIAKLESSQSIFFDKQKLRMDEVVSY